MCEYNFRMNIKTLRGDSPDRVLLFETWLSLRDVCAVLPTKTFLTIT